MKIKISIQVITILLILLWCYSGITKLIDYPIFRSQLMQSPVIGSAGPAIALLLPLLELVTALMLVFAPLRLSGLYLSLGLLTTFTAYIICLYTFFSTKIPCSCSGIIERLGWKGHLIFNGVYLILTYICIRLYKIIYPKHVLRQGLT